MKRLAKVLAVVEAIFVVATVWLGLWAGWKAVEGTRSIDLLETVWPGPRTAELAAQQTSTTRITVVAEALWASCVVLGAMAAFFLWRLRFRGLVASILLSVIYLACVLGRWRVGSSWVPMGGVTLLRVLLAGALARSGILSRE